MVLIVGASTDVVQKRRIVRASTDVIQEWRIVGSSPQTRTWRNWMECLNKYCFIISGLVLVQSSLENIY